MKRFIYYGLILLILPLFVYSCMKCKCPDCGDTQEPDTEIQTPQQRVMSTNGNHDESCTQRQVGSTGKNKIIEDTQYMNAYWDADELHVEAVLYVPDDQEIQSIKPSINNCILTLDCTMKRPSCKKTPPKTCNYVYKEFLFKKNKNSLYKIIDFDSICPKRIGTSGLPEVQIILDINYNHKIPKDKDGNNIKNENGDDIKIPTRKTKVIAGGGG